MRTFISIIMMINIIILHYAAAVEFIRLLLDNSNNRNIIIIIIHHRFIHVNATTRINIIVIANILLLYNGVIIIVYRYVIHDGWGWSGYHSSSSSGGCSDHPLPHRCIIVVVTLRVFSGWESHYL